MAHIASKAVRTALIFSALSCASSALGQEDTPLRQCTSLAEAAEVIMRGRQNGIDVVQQYENATEAAPAIRDLMTSLVTLAYEQPMYSGDAHKDQEVARFKSELMVRCMKAKS